MADSSFACPSPSSQADRRSLQSGSATSNPPHNPVGGGANHLAVVAVGGMVWGTLLPAGDYLTNRSLVSPWITCGAHSLGTGERPAGKLEPQAFLSTNLEVTREQILLWFRQRWQVEVTFEEVRVHLGVETQRQWSDLAMLRTTPGILALFSIVVLLAQSSSANFP